MKAPILISLAFLAIAGQGCSARQSTIETLALEREEIANKSANDTAIVSGAIVEKEFYNKGGHPRGFNELYFRTLENDFFIKFCESSVSKEELENYIRWPSVPEIRGGKFVTLEIEIRRGLFCASTCAGGFLNRASYQALGILLAEPQSRVGTYAIVRRIVQSGGRSQRRSRWVSRGSPPTIDVRPTIQTFSISGYVPRARGLVLQIQKPLSEPQHL